MITGIIIGIIVACAFIFAALFADEWGTLPPDDWWE